MLKIRLAADVAPISGDFRWTLDRVRDLSFEGVELDLVKLMPLEDFTHTAVREIRKHLTDRGLALALVRLRLPRGLDDPEGLEQRLESLRRAMDLTYQLGGSITAYKMGFVPENEASPHWQILREILVDIGRWSERVGALLALETGHDPPERLEKFLRQLPQGALGLDFNPAEFALHGFDPRQALERLGPWILAYHATDVTSRPGGRGYQIVPLGHGNLDHPELLSALEQSGYQGFLIVRPTGDGDALAELKQAKEFIFRL